MPAVRRHFGDFFASKTRRALQRDAFVKIFRPFRRRHFGHAAEQALFRPRAHQHETVGAARDKSGAAAQRPFPLRHASRKCLGIAARVCRAAFVPGTQRAGRRLRRADGGAEIHHGLGEIAGAPWRRQSARQPGNFRLRRRQRRVDRIKPRDDALDIAVDRRRRRIERDGGDGGGGIGADAGQSAKTLFARGELTAVPLDHDAGASVQIAGAGVIAEAGPGLEHVVERRRRQRPEIGPARQKACVIGPDRLDRGLLQHDFGQPDAIRIGALSRRRAPRQLAAMAVVPGQQVQGPRRRKRGRGLVALSPRWLRC